VVLDPDVAEVFTTSDEVNHALRALAGVIQSQRPKAAPKKSGTRARARRPQLAR
jgi:hypothetical protein